ncbi:MAG TPA: hypothetical protein VM537_21205 [Anaerolineae bacterium]|nr:hypothetical protein [Anaerolineae bacterium]HUX75487.1 hypothetical protein [Anaerolineae bacterium]
MIASVARETGLSIQAWKTTIVRGVSYTTKAQSADPYLAERATSYDHIIKADGGWWSAELTFAAAAPLAEEWYEEGLGRHVEVHAPTGGLIWAGFVDTVSITMGTLSATAGPLLEVANRVSVAYTPILDTAPMLTGAQTVTVIADDTDSQDRYGILEDVVSGGEMLDDGVTDDAAKYRGSYIEEHKLPTTDERLVLGAGQDVKVTLGLMGYVHLLKRYITNTALTATCSVYTKILDALGDDPNALFSTDYVHMAPNAWLVSRNEEKNRNAWAVIGEMVQIGDAADTRYIFGVYEGQRFHYQPVDTEAKYQHKISQAAMRVELLSGVLVEPWRVEAGKWIFLSDFLASRTPAGSAPIRRDHRYVFIEQVTYRAPGELEIQGGHYSNLAQWLAKKGLSA